MKPQPNQRVTRLSSKGEKIPPKEKSFTTEFKNTVSFLPEKLDKKTKEHLVSFDFEIITSKAIDEKLKPIQAELEKLIRTYNSLKFTLGDINSSLRQVNIQLSQIEGQTKEKQSWFKKIFSKK